MAQIKNYKKNYDLFIKSHANNSTQVLKELTIIDSILNCELKTDYEVLIKRSMTNSEINLICDFVNGFNSIIEPSVIIYNLFRLFTETKYYDEALSTRQSVCRLKDLKDEDKSSKIYNFITESIYEYSSDFDYLF